MSSTFQADAATWHVGRQPQSAPTLLVMKAVEELGEVARAIHGRGDVPGEAADVVVALAILVGRFYPDRDLLADAAAKLAHLQTTTHPYAAGDGDQVISDLLHP